MLSTRSVLLLCLVALCACVAVEARHSRLSQASKAAAAATADASTEALYARVRAEMEARNYSRPTASQLVELGYRSAEELESLQADGVYGVDVSTAVIESKWQCMKQKGFHFAIVRGFMETCHVDPNGRNSVAAAWAGGMAHVDLYLFPSYGCGTSAAGQMDALIDSMGNTPYGTIWLDIETGGQGSAANNHAWMMAALAQGVKRIGAKRLGIYSSAHEWGLVMGNLAGPTEYPVWYAGYDGQPGFGNWIRFGGWTTPAMHQWTGTTDLCGAGVDQNWYP